MKISYNSKNIFIYLWYTYINMIIIDVTKEKSIESALRTYKQKVQKVKQVQKLRARQAFVKPSVNKRKEVLNAIYVQQKKNGLS